MAAEQGSGTVSAGRPSGLQIALYAAIAAVLLLLALRSLGGETAGGADPGFVEVADGPREGGPGPGAGSGDAVVHVAGEVAKPGVYRMAAGSRVADAIKRAGGATDGAASDSINLAARLADGQQVVVPTRAPGGGTAAAAGEDGPISLGSASATDLEEIEGIGPVTAESIIEYRDQNGGISSVEDLDEISGIGPTTIDSLSDRLQP